jgi:RNA polymerase-binding protein DksA
MTIDAKILDELKSALVLEKEKLEQNLGRIAKPIDKEEGDYETSFEDIGTDKDDNATEVDQYTQNLSIENSLEKQLQDILEALEKIEKGAYGKCENCGKDIPLERLTANPSARTCLDC